MLTLSALVTDFCEGKWSYLNYTPVASDQRPSERWSFWRGSVIMMASSNGNIFRVTGPLCGEFTGHRWIPLTKASNEELSSDVFLNKRLSKELRRRWFETLSRSLWRHCNDYFRWWPVLTCRPQAGEEHEGDPYRQSQTVVGHEQDDGADGLSSRAVQYSLTGSL